MKFRYHVLLTFILICSSLHTLFAQREYGKTTIADLVLIYHGGVHRPLEWTKDDFLPYIVHEDQQGNKNWLFDGFLFLEFKDGKGKNFAPGYDSLNAQKQDWKWLLDRNFQKNRAFSALNQCIGEQKKELGKPCFQHKLVAGLPSPILNQKNWGELNGRELDFSSVEDRIEAAKWYVDQFLERYKKAKYKNLKLQGFYWVDEDMKGCADILIPIGDYIRSKKLKFVWIPYWWAPGYDKWKEYKFDFAWIQPNHFFNQKISDERIDQACSFAQGKNMGMEMEFDNLALMRYDQGFRKRLVAYIDHFEKNDVFSKASIAYYEGGKGFLDFYKSTNHKDKELIDRLAKHITDRKKKEFLDTLPKK